MDRKPEPELMDSEAQTRAYAEADFSESNQLFTDRFLAHFPDLPPTGRLIDLGCGPADICIRLARRLSRWTVIGLDAGENMLRRAREALAGAGLEQRIELLHAHLPDPSLGTQCFEAVTSNSLLHHLPAPETLWLSVRQLARPGAPVMVMDLERPDSVANAERLVETYAADAPEVLRQDFYHSLQAAYTVGEVEQQLREAGLSWMTVERPSDRHWLAAGRRDG